MTPTGSAVGWCKAALICCNKASPKIVQLLQALRVACFGSIAGQFPQSRLPLGDRLQLLFLACSTNGPNQLSINQSSAR